MQALLTETKAKEAKETLQKRRNLFGLGLTSLIAACGADKAAGGGGDGDNGGGPGDPVTLPFEAEALSKDDIGYSATVSGTDSLTVEVKEAEETKATLIFSDADNTLPNTVNVYQLTSTENQYDLVISAPNIDKSGSSDNPEYRKGKIFIYWDIASVTGKDSTHLEIKGAIKEAQIGTFAPDFLQLTGTDNNYDMVIRSSENDKVISGSRTYEGAIYILWDVADYKTGTTKTIDLGKLGEDGTPNLNATAGSLAIYGLITGDIIGVHAPEFLQLGGAGNKYDMVIRSERVDNPDGPAFLGDNEGGIFILWDVVDYKASTLNKSIILDSSLSNNADSGLLAIYGLNNTSAIGTYAPDFLELGGADNKHDMVIRTSSPNGGVYILWDIEDYYKDADEKIANKRIDLDKIGDANNAALDATAGSLAIYGTTRNDFIGTYAPEFLQIGGTDNAYDMVIRSELVDNLGDGIGINNTNEGAIYVLWGIADYYKDGSNAILHKDIYLDVVNDNDGYYATSGLLTIYGAARQAKLGSDANNILYGSDDDGNKILTNIDGDDAGTNDIAFRDNGYTYILFGDKVAEVDGTTQKVTSKTIDLTKITADGFFEYNGANLTDTSNHTATPIADKTNATGYRFASGTGSGGTDGYKTLAAVQTAYDALPSSLSDTDADLGVWDIA